MAISKTLNGRLLPTDAEIANTMIVYVNAYEVTRHYGGPEEGGWWYDAGTPIASVPVRIPRAGWDGKEPEPEDGNEMARLQFRKSVQAAEDEITKAKDDLIRVLGPEYRHRRSRYSVIGEEDLSVSVDDKPGKPWPEETPHYE